MFFDHCATLAEIKALYRELAQKHHPDHGGDTATMQQVNAAYTEAVKHFSRYGSMPKTERKQAADRRRSTKEVERAIDAIKDLPGLTIELVGLWVWVSGNTYPHREILKANSYKWAPKKKMWYFAGIPICKFGHSEMRIDDIRNKYGSETIASTLRLSA